MTWDKIFNLTENRTTVRTEILAGLTTFLTMAYIVFVQPAVLSKDFTGAATGLDFGAVLVATCLTSSLTSIFMGLYARYPIALAPGMGENFFFVSVIMTLTAHGIANAWQTALGIVFVSGVLFLLLSVLRIREAILDTISPSMRNGIAVGIGLFIAFIGLREAGIIVGKPGTLIGMNAKIMTADAAVFFFGLLVIAMLSVRRIRGSILWGILSATALAFLLGKIKFTGIFGLPHLVEHAAFKMDVKGALTLTCLPFILVFLFMNIFDTLGTLVGVAEQAGFVKDNRLPRASHVLVVDSAGTVAGACLGTSSIVCYIESATGVAFGGRTGLTAVTTGLLFLLPLCFAPIVGMIGNYAPITAPALLIVGVLMMQNVKKIQWDDFSECVPAFLAILGIPLSYSIADGLVLGFISYPLVKLLSGRGKEVRWLMYVIAATLLAYYILVRAKLG